MSGDWAVDSSTTQSPDYRTSLWLDRDLDQRGGPAAAEAAAAVARVVIAGDVEDIIAGLGELRRGVGLAVERRPAGHLLDLRPRLVERNRARTAILAPAHRHW